MHKRILYTNISQKFVLNNSVAITESLSKKFHSLIHDHSHVL